jgi:hypothetical protein
VDLDTTIGTDNQEFNSKLSHFRLGIGRQPCRPIECLYVEVFNSAAFDRNKINDAMLTYRPENFVTLAQKPSASY